MPELVEVERTRRSIEQNFLGKKIEGIGVNEFDEQVLQCEQAKVGELIGKTIKSVKRKGKYLWLELDSPPHVMFHFGLVGDLIVKGIEAPAYRHLKITSGEWPPASSKILFFFEDDKQFAFVETRKIGYMKLCEGEIEKSEAWTSLASDPIVNPVTFQEFSNIFDW